jgi:hypothetical protein
VMFREFSWFLFTLFLQWDFDPNGQGDDGSANIRNALGAIVLLAVLVLLGLWIIDALRQADALQDCVLQGRTNCLPSLR